MNENAIVGQAMQYLVSGLTVGSVYAIVALGFTLIFNVSGIINFAQGEFVMLGGMIGWWLSTGLHLPALVAFPLAVALTAGAGIALERLAIRPALAAPALSLVILTVGASIAIRGVAGLAWGRDPVALPAFTGEAPIQVLGAAVHPQSLWVIGVTLGAMALLELGLSRTMLGRALKACSINRHYAELVGIDPERMTMLAFGLSAALGALGGIVVAPMTMASYDGGVMLGLKGFTAAAVGGLGSQLGAVLGGLVLGVLESFGAAVRSEFKDAIALVSLFVVLFLRRGRVAAEARR